MTLRAACACVCLLALGLSGCRSDRVVAHGPTADRPLRVEKTERTSEKTSIGGPAHSRIVAARAARVAKHAVPLPRSVASGRVRASRAVPTPRRAWFDLVPDSPASR